MEYTILILALPILSFLILALTGMYMKHRIAGLIGTLSLAGVTILSYLTAINYFTAPHTAEGVFPTLTPWNIQWLPFTESLHIDMGIYWTHFRYDAGCHLDSQSDGTYLLNSDT